jgi:hypothetical protein
MAFPDEPRDIVTEIYVNGDWVDISSDVRGDTDGITVTHGRPNEAGDPQPSACTFVLNNPDGHYSPDWPEGDYYGTLDRNTPTRTTINVARDTFTRTVANGLGTMDTGQTYVLSGFGGSVVAGDWDVTSGVATVSIPAANAQRRMKITGDPDTFYDVDVAVTVTVPFTDVTGATLVPLSIVLRDLGGDDSVWAQILINTAEEIYLRIWDGVTDTEIGPEEFISELTHTAAQALRMRFQVEGHMFRAKVWAAGTPEPYGWRVTAWSGIHPTAGQVTFYGWVVTGNTNAKPIVLSYDDVVVRSLVHAGEVSSWPANWDVSGQDITATVESYGITRRLGQGTAPVQSTLYRGISSLTTLLAYWPGEDGSESSVLNSATGGPPITITGATTFASYSDIAATQPIPTFGTGGVWTGLVPVHTDPTELQLRFLMHIPDGGLTPAFATGAVICDIHTTSGYHWSVWYHTGGLLSSHLTRFDTTTVYDSGPASFGGSIDGRNVMVSLEVEQSGANVDLTLEVLDVGVTVGFFITTTIASRPVLPVQRVMFGNNADCSGMALGQIYLTNTVADLFELADELEAYQGETALVRMRRLCSQNDVVFTEVSNTAIDSERVGPQRPLTLLQLLNECADADRGTLYDSKGRLGLIYRERAAIYNQTDRLVIDYSAGQIGEPFKPVRDDQATRNDITVNRTNGGRSIAALTEGPMSTQERADGGVGRYDTALTLNVADDAQLDDLAGFELRKGTVAKTRYPSVVLNLHNPNVAADDELAINALDLGVDDRFTIINPKAGQTADDISLIARGWSRYLTNFIDTLTINAAPAEPYDVLRLDGDATYPSKWDTGGSELASGVTTTATSFSVTVTGTQLWTTDAGQMPIPILIGGEEVSVTAISGGSSPQTFTVTRSVNGVVKTHAAGTALSLRTRPVLGL